MELSNFNLLGDDIKNKHIKSIYPSYSYTSGDEKIYEECAKKTGFIPLPNEQMQKLGLHNSGETTKAFNDCVAKKGGHNFWDVMKENSGALLNLGTSIFNYLSNKGNKDSVGGGINQGENGTTEYYGSNDGSDNDLKKKDKFLGMPKPVGITVSIVGGITFLIVTFLGIKRMFK